jgi:carbamoyltransferase
VTSRGDNRIVVGVGGVRRAACVAVRIGGRVSGVCEQERVTRVRSAGCNPSGLPDEALDLMLARAGRSRADVGGYVIAEPPVGPKDHRWTRIDHHRAHAETTFFSSGFTSAVIAVCDQDAPKMSVWRGDGASVVPVTGRWNGPGLADTYSACAQAAGFEASTGDQRFEALARLAAAAPVDGHRLPAAHVDATSLGLEADWAQVLSNRMQCSRGGDLITQARAAASLQDWVIGMLVTWLAQVQRATNATQLCLGGSLFHHSSLITAVRNSKSFEQVFVPVNPGNTGLALGTVLHGVEAPASTISPFLGPEYTPDEIKAVLDNCKLRYDWLSESQAIERALDALLSGRLVAWYEGPMEWGPRALGGRSILANPFEPYVLENLNRFLKHREPWRGYAMSVLSSAVQAHFTGPVESSFMECDFRPIDADRFRSVLPAETAALRLHTAGDSAPARFRALLRAFGDRTGIPCLVNTSFNGFQEPIVCTPRDAIRVFYGTGVDMMLLDRFVLTK